MWRNILGHSVYQLAVLVILIFLVGAKDNWLVYDYQTDCLQFARGSSTVCAVFNPFYARGLYWTQEEVNQWHRRYATGQFDQGLLAKLTAAPQEGQETQKLLHFTLI